MEVNKVIIKRLKHREIITTLRKHLHQVSLIKLQFKWTNYLK